MRSQFRGKEGELHVHVILEAIFKGFFSSIKSKCNIILNHLKFTNPHCNINSDDEAEPRAAFVNIGKSKFAKFGRK